MSLSGAKNPSSKSILLILLGVLSLMIGLGLMASMFSLQAIDSLKKGNYEQSLIYFNIAQPLVKSVDVMTLSLIPDLDLWHSGLRLLNSSAQLAETSQLAKEQLAGSDKKLDLTKLAEQVKSVNQNLIKTTHQIPRAWLANKYISKEQVALLEQAASKLPIITQLLSSVAKKPNQTWVVLLQNSDEIRPTGGFTGSYALIYITDGHLADIVVEDIYDADGQFTGYIDPPPGVKEYTSGNHGLRLPDANWWPDFPKSAQTQLQFLAFGERQDISGVVAVNLAMVEQLLDITGSVWLPDNQINLTANNVHQILRAERGTFFPGSQQKKNLIDHAQSMLRQKISQLDMQQQLRLIQLLNQSLQKKDIQLYAINPELQQVLATAHIGGVVGINQYADTELVKDCGCQPRLIMPVEANVGINKVNRYVSRKYHFQFNPNQVVVTIDLHNTAVQPSTTNLSSLIPASQVSAFITKDNQNGYINYLQLLVDPSYQVESIIINDRPITSWDEDEITTTDETSLKNIGVLTAVPAASRAQIAITFQTRDGFPPTLVVLPKQAGIPDSEYTIETNQEIQQGIWDKDLLLQLR